MRPIPIPKEVVDAMNVGEQDATRFRKITMAAPQKANEESASGTLEDGTPCDDVEVIVDTVLTIHPQTKELKRYPRQFMLRIGVTKEDVEAIAHHGHFYVALWGDHLQPIALWAEAIEDADTNGG